MHTYNRSKTRVQLHIALVTEIALCHMRTSLIMQAIAQTNDNSIFADGTGRSCGREEGAVEGDRELAVWGDRKLWEGTRVRSIAKCLVASRVSMCVQYADISTTAFGRANLRDTGVCLRWNPNLCDDRLSETVLFYASFHSHSMRSIICVAMNLSNV